MPYIQKENRDRIDEYLNKFVNFKIENPGELNYVLTRIIHNYFLYNGRRYQQINDVIGALEGCKLEFYRKLVSKYEDEKIKVNGDVY